MFTALYGVWAVYGIATMARWAYYENQGSYDDPLPLFGHLVMAVIPPFGIAWMIGRGLSDRTDRLKALAKHEARAREHEERLLREAGL